ACAEFVDESGGSEPLELEVDLTAGDVPERSDRGADRVVQLPAGHRVVLTVALRRRSWTELAEPEQHGRRSADGVADVRARRLCAVAARIVSRGSVDNPTYSIMIVQNGLSRKELGESTSASAAKWITCSGGRRLAFAEFGDMDGTPVVFCHGWM